VALSLGLWRLIWVKAPNCQFGHFTSECEGDIPVEQVKFLRQQATERERTLGLKSDLKNGPTKVMTKELAE
jgi:hypothetical protein